MSYKVAKLLKIAFIFENNETYINNSYNKLIKQPIVHLILTVEYGRFIRLNMKIHKNTHLQ